MDLPLHIEPAQKKRIVRGATVILVLTCILAALVLVLAWQRLNRHLNSPGFSAALEKGLSERLEGTLTFGSLRAHLGVHPWVGVQEVSFKAANGDWRWTASLVRVNVAVFPLFQRRVVLSNALIEEPRAWVRRRSDGSAPSFPLFKGEETPGEGALTFRVTDLDVQDAELELVDESLPGQPSVSLMNDLSIERHNPGDPVSIELTGRLKGPNERGRYRLTGQMGTESNLRLEGSRLPLGLAVEFFPILKPWAGTLRLNGQFTGGRGRWRWWVKGGVTELHWREREDQVPLTAEWALDSGTTSKIQVAWESEGTQARLDATVPNLRKPEVTLTVAGERLDLAEFVEFFKRVPPPPPPSKSPAGAQKAKLNGTVALGKVAWGDWTLNRVLGEVDWQDGAARLTRWDAEVYGGSMTAQGLWVSAGTSTFGVTLTDVDLGELGQSVPAIGLRSGRATLAGDWHSDRSPKTFRDILFGAGAQWNFDMQLSSADWRGVPLSDAMGRVQWSPPGALEVTDLKGNISGGAISGKAVLEGLEEGTTVTFAMDAQVKDLETRELAQAISTSSYLTHGRFDGALSLAGPLYPWDPSQLNGRVMLKGRNGSFRVAPAVLKVFSALKIRSLLQRAEGQKAEGLPFDILEASAPIRDGRYLATQPVILKNSALQLAYTGWMDVRFENAKGTVLFNFLQGTSDLIKAIPGLSALVLSPEGEFVPLVVDVSVEGGEAKVNPRSIQTLTGPLVGVVKNVFRLPFRLFTPKKKQAAPAQ